MPDFRFTALHLDIVGPLPESEGHSYLLTVIDRFSRWLEAIPLVDITAKTCATALLRHWVARYGVPASIVTDRGRQFTSELWAELAQVLGISRRQTTSYHPQSNGLIERQHRILKDRLIARACASHKTSWMSLLGMRTSIREDSGCSPSDLLYGSPLRLPGGMCAAPPSSPPPSPSALAAHLRHVLQSSSLMPIKYHGAENSKFRVDGRLASSSHIFLRVDAVNRPLVPPYEGLYPVLERSPKAFTILLRGKPSVVSVDRLKPAQFLPEPDGPPVAVVPTPTVTAFHAEAEDAAPLPVVARDGPGSLQAPAGDVPCGSPDTTDSFRTASGRVSRPPDRFQA